MINIAFLSTAHVHTKGFLEVIAQATDGRTAYVEAWDIRTGRKLWTAKGP